MRSDSSQEMGYFAPLAVKQELDMSRSELEAVGKAILTSAMKVHSALGPGLLESAYEVCLAYELTNLGMAVERQVELPVIYAGIRLDAGYRLDVLVERKVIVEVKALRNCFRSIPRRF
jgi:GxxExxY protein